MVLAPHQHFNHHTGGSPSDEAKHWWEDDDTDTDVLDEVLRDDAAAAADDDDDDDDEQASSSSSSAAPSPALASASSSLASRQLGARTLAHHLACALTVSLGSVCQAALLSTPAQWLWAAAGYEVLEEGVRGVAWGVRCFHGPCLID